MTYEKESVDGFLDKVDKPVIETMLKASWDFGPAVEKYIQDSFDYIFGKPPVLTEVPLEDSK